MIERYSRPQMKKVWSDESKFAYWLDIEIAVCEAWAKMGAISREDITKIKLARLNFKRMEELLKETHHDMTAFLGSVAESLGEESRFIHMGMTSSDVMDTALSLQLVEASKILNNGVKDLINALAAKAMEYKYTVQVGRTHGVHAEPISFGLKLALWMEEMKRNRQRLAEATKAITVGKMSGAVGTYATLSPEIEEIACKKLGLSPASISNQVIQRDRHAQYMTTLAIIAGSLEKFATEIRALQKTECHEAEEPFEKGQTGSSAMPHKKNPELCERICGIARIIRGYSVTAMENQPLWHERDISHSSTERVIMPDGCLLIDYALHIFTNVIKGLNVFPEQMEKNLNLTGGLVYSQRVMLALINKGLSRQQAYKMVQRNAMRTWQGEDNFMNLLKADAEVMQYVTSAEIDELFDYKFYLRYIDDIFSRVGLTNSQWKKGGDSSSDEGLSPRAI
ncbi:adenylosuccinate lyase [Dehalococcoides sp. THU3]|uniref:adenylosuccinate lyase n=1 Tax=Dehalococcoides TaxID=61434 RepID=UPI0005B57D04|nr:MULTISPECIES: adenylosuccinate lyase [Dehalococcoides]UJP38314.1 adenylosuccinate lyase [Dehalococcoides mccartyi]BAQ34664.1 adenylosuccinate lyase [Dehalococcoides sp. UCH007]